MELINEMARREYQHRIAGYANLGRSIRELARTIFGEQYIQVYEDIAAKPIDLEIKTELATIGRDYQVTLTNNGKTALIQLPAPSALESRRIMQTFNTPKYRAQRKDRRFDLVEVKYRS